MIIFKLSTYLIKEQYLLDIFDMYVYEKYYILVIYYIETIFVKYYNYIYTTQMSKL